MAGSFRHVPDVAPSFAREHSTDDVCEGPGRPRLRFNDVIVTCERIEETYRQVVGETMRKEGGRETCRGTRRKLR
jgi:hypothetical protein